MSRVRVREWDTHTQMRDRNVHTLCTRIDVWSLWPLTLLILYCNPLYNPQQMCYIHGTRHANTRNNKKKKKKLPQFRTNNERGSLYHIRISTKHWGDGRRPSSSSHLVWHTGGDSAPSAQQQQQPKKPYRLWCACRQTTTSFRMLLLWATAYCVYLPLKSWRLVDYWTHQTRRSLSDRLHKSRICPIKSSNVCVRVCVAQFAAAVNFHSCLVRN